MPNLNAKTLSSYQAIVLSETLSRELWVNSGLLDKLLKRVFTNFVAKKYSEIVY